MNSLYKVALILLISLLMLTAVSGCGKKDSKVLRMGTNAEFPPFEYKDGDSFVGVDIDLARQIAAKLDMELQIVDMDFDTLLPSVSSNKIDFAMSAISITEERQALVDFSQPYYVVNQVIIRALDGKVKLDNPQDIVKYKVGVQGSTTCEAYMKDNYVDKGTMSQDNLMQYPSNIEAISALLSGIVDFVIIDASAAKGYAQQKPIEVVHQIETNENYGIALPKNGSKNDKIKQALKELLDSGEVQSIIQTHIN